MTKRIEVSLSNQIVEAFDDKAKVYSFECVTGDADHPTVAGKFKVTSKDKTHVSHKYKAPMHYALFFSSDGKALHQYHGVPPLYNGIPPLSVVRMAKNVSDFFGSHGCVRLSEDDAKALFEWTPVNTVVIVR